MAHVDHARAMDRHVTREDLHRELRTLLFQIGVLGLALAGIIIGVMAALI
jgi:hypothetical protein